MVAKVIPVLLLSRLARIPDVRPWQLAIGPGQIGEFSFVLACIVLGRALIPPALYSAVLAAVVATIVISTTLVRLGHRPAVAQAATPGLDRNLGGNIMRSVDQKVSGRSAAPDRASTTATIPDVNSEPVQVG